MTLTCTYKVTDTVGSFSVWVLSRVPLCNPMDYCPSGSSVHGIFKARILEWVAISSSRGYSWPRDQSHISCTGRSHLGIPKKWIYSLCVLSRVQLTVTPWTVCSPPDSSVHGILSPDKNTGLRCHALFQEIFVTQGLNPRLLCLLHWQAGSLPVVLPRKP